MFVAVFPPTPSGALTGALISTGYSPVPVADVAEAGLREPEQGWSAVDRTLTTDLGDRDGFDDFVLTPIDQHELAVRLGRLNRIESVEYSDPVLRHEDLELNTATYQATIGGKPRDLTFMEYELLRFFVEHPHRVWSREQILSKVWGYDYYGGSRTVDVHVRRLRAKLGEERSSWIATVRSVGYRFG